jgi:predicted DNA-binding protein with PD1-like motif
MGHATSSHRCAVHGDWRVQRRRARILRLGRKDYQKISIHEQVEVLSLVGNIALKGSEPSLHAHVVLGKADGSAHGGHLLEAHVRPTLEVVIEEAPRELRRVFDSITGLALLDAGKRSREREK